MRKWLSSAVTSIVLGLSGLTCQTNDICRNVQGACLAIEIDAELEPLPFPNVTLETILTTTSNSEITGDPDQSRYPLGSLPVLWRITNLPNGVTPAQISKLEVVARGPSSDGGKTPGEIIASGIVAPLSWADGATQRHGVKLAPVAKTNPLSAPRVSTSGGTIIAVSGTRMCYPGKTSVTVGGAIATVKKCSKESLEFTAPPLPFRREEYPILVQTGAGREVAVGTVGYYPANIDFNAMRAFPLRDPSFLEVGTQIPPTFITDPTGTISMVGYRRGLAIGDFDGDSHLDIIVPNYNNGTIQILWGGLSNFDQFDLIDIKINTNSTKFNPYSVAVSDINKDGLDDLYIASYGSPSVKDPDRCSAGECLYAIYGTRIRNNLGKNWAQIGFQALQVAPYSIIPGQILPDQIQGTTQSLLVLDGQCLTEDVMGMQRCKAPLTQTDEVSYCWGLSYPSASVPGQKVLCQNPPKTERPFDRNFPAFEEGTNGFISSLSPVLSATGAIEALLMTNYGRRHVTIITNKALKSGTSDKIFDLDQMQNDFFNNTKLSGNPVGSVLSDIDGDGDRDLIVAIDEKSKGGILQIFRQGGTGYRELDQRLNQYIVTTTDGVTVHPSDLKVGDLDRDGKDDLVLSTTRGLMLFLTGSPGKNGLALPDSPQAISPDLHIESGTWRSQMTLPNEIALTDLNKDGTLDIIMIDKESSILGVLYINTVLGNGFRIPDYLYRINPKSSAGNQNAYGVSAYSRDNKLTIAASNYEFKSINVFSSDGNMQCCANKFNINIDSNARGFSVLVRDFDHDGMADYAASYLDETGTQSGVWIFNGLNPNSNKSRLFNDNTGGYNIYIQPINPNGDGYDDMLFIRYLHDLYFAKNISQPGQIKFDTPYALSLSNLQGGAPIAAAPLVFGGDCSGNAPDNLEDLVVASDSRVYIYINQGISASNYFGGSPAQSCQIFDNGGDSFSEIKALKAANMYRSNHSDIVMLSDKELIIFDPTQPTTKTTQRVALSYVANRAVDMVIADMDQDNINDIIILNQARSLISIYSGQDDAGGRRWSLKGHYVAGSTSTALSVIDYDRDGLLDILTSNEGGATVSIIKNNSH